MLVTPNDEVKELRQEAFGKIARLGIRVMILVYTCEVEPFVLVQVGLEELHISVTKCSEEALVSDVAHAVQREFRGTLLKQDRLDLYVVGFRCSAVVVQETGHL